MLFGASGRGIRCLNIIGRDKVICFCDNDNTKVGTYLENKIVINVKRLVELIEKEPEVVIVITSTFETEILDQLRLLGLENKVDRFYLQRLRALFGQRAEGYWPGRYNSIESINGQLKNEYYYGTIIEKHEWVSLNSCNEVYPLKAIYPNTTITVKYETREYTKRLSDTFYDYMPIRNAHLWDIKSDKDFILGNSIQLKQAPHKRQLRMLIISDSLSGNILNEFGFENLMPNTSRFFEDGMIFQNCYSCGDWTLPCIATIFTGKLSKEHGFVHPEWKKNKVVENLITKEFKESGYLTSFFGCNWRNAPEYGYIKDMDRFVYLEGYSEGTACEFITNVMEHLRAFSDRDHFIVLNLMDLHHLRQPRQDISCQIAEGIEEYFYTDTHDGKSVTKSYDENKKKMYVEEIKKLDYYLEILYHFLNLYYKDNMEVIFASDHGVTYLDKEEYIYKDCSITSFMRDSMLHVPLMIKAPELHREEVKGLTDNSRISKLLRYLLKDEEISNKAVKEYMLKDIVVNESIYPGQTYKIRMIDREYDIYFESKNIIGDDCKVQIEGYDLKVIQKSRKKFIVNPIIIQKYLDIIMEHIK